MKEEFYGLFTIQERQISYMVFFYFYFLILIFIEFFRYRTCLHSLLGLGPGLDNLMSASSRTERTHNGGGMAACPHWPSRPYKGAAGAVRVCVWTRPIPAVCRKGCRRKHSAAQTTQKDVGLVQRVCCPSQGELYLDSWRLDKLRGRAKKSGN